MNRPVDNTLHFRAMTFGTDRDTDSVTVGFEMDRRPGHDARGLLVSRAAPEHDDGDGIYVEFGEPQQHCMYGGIEKAQSLPGHFRIQFSDAGAKQMAGLRAIDVDYDKAAEEASDLVRALDYIFEGFAGYSANDGPGAAPSGNATQPAGDLGPSDESPSVS